MTTVFNEPDDPIAAQYWSALEIRDDGVRRGGQFEPAPGTAESPAPGLDDRHVQRRRVRSGTGLCRAWGRGMVAGR